MRLGFAKRGACALPFYALRFVGEVWLEKSEQRARQEQHRC